MGALTKGQTIALAHVLRNLQRAERFLFSDRIRVCRTDTQATTTLHYALAPVSLPESVALQADKPRALFPIERNYGSDMVAVRTALDALTDFLSQNRF